MEIAHVVRQFSPGIGGLEEAVGQLAHAQASAGHAVRVITLDRLFTAPDRPLAHRESLGPVEILRVPWRGSSRYPIAPGILRGIASADVVHVHAIDFAFDFLALTAPWHKRRLVASTHGGFFHTAYAARLKRMWFDRMTRASVRAYRAICASSEADHALFAQICGGNLHLVPNGVDVRKWHSASAVDPQPVMLCLGRFSANKNIPAIMPVLAALAQQDARWRLIIAGMESDLTAVQLMNAAEAAGVGKRVTIAVGLDNDAIRGLIARSSYVVSASRHEGFGLGIVEGLSAGLFPLLSEIPAFSSLIDATGQGLAINFEQPAEAATAIAGHFKGWLACGSALRERLIAASEPYSWIEAARRFDAIYQRVVCQPA